MDPNQPRFTANYASEFKLPSGVKNLAVIAFFIVLVMIFWMWLSSPMVVTVAGSGEVSVPATNATISFTLSSNDGNPQAAINNVKARAETMRQYLLSKGISEEDIIESQVTAVPASLVSQGAQGYQATITMAAKTVHVSDVSNLLSELYANGALVVSQPLLSVEDQEQLEKEAFNMALKDAKKKAGSVGLANWKFIRKVISISQVTSPATSTSTTKADVLTQVNNQIAAVNGVFKIIKTVSVSYRMW